jgi:hypothetical protein
MVHFLKTKTMRCLAVSTLLASALILPSVSRACCHRFHNGFGRGLFFGLAASAVAISIWNDHSHWHTYERTTRRCYPYVDVDGSTRCRYYRHYYND